MLAVQGTATTKCLILQQSCNTFCPLSDIVERSGVSAPHSFGRLCSPLLSPDLGWDASQHALCMSAEGTLPTENLLTVQIDQEKL